MRRHLAVPVLMAVSLAGCHSWHRYEPPFAGLRSDTVAAARVQLRDGARHEWERVTFSGGQVFGRSADPASADAGAAAIPVDSVEWIEVRRFDSGETMKLGLLGGGLAVALVVDCLLTDAQLGQLC